VIVPALQLLNPQAWSYLLDYVEAGGTLLVNGVLARDQHNLPFDPTIAGLAAASQPTPISFYETLTGTTGQTYQLTFANETTNYVKKAHNQVCTYQYGAGHLIWSGLPLELASETTALKALYRQALQQPLRGEEDQPASPLMVTQRAVKDGKLFLVISESSSPQSFQLAEEGLELTIAPNRAGALLLDNDGSVRTFSGLSIQR